MVCFVPYDIWKIGNTIYAVGSGVASGPIDEQYPPRYTKAAALHFSKFGLDGDADFHTDGDSDRDSDNELDSDSEPHFIDDGSICLLAM